MAGKRARLYWITTKGPPRRHTIILGVRRYIVSELGNRRVVAAITPADRPNELITSRDFRSVADAQTWVRKEAGRE